ncbi:hypothetical protein MKX03_025818, partial [Papaver bracteatum]
RLQVKKDIKRSSKFALKSPTHTPETVRQLFYKRPGRNGPGTTWSCFVHINDWSCCVHIRSL